MISGDGRTFKKGGLFADTWVIGAMSMNSLVGPCIFHSLSAPWIMRIVFSALSPTWDANRGLTSVHPVMSLDILHKEESLSFSHIS